MSVQLALTVQGEGERVKMVQRAVTREQEGEEQEQG
jgi:hypothetical protein